MKQHFPGVFETQKKNGTIYYRSSITHQQKHISLGGYETATLAYAAYLEAASILTNNELSLQSYSSLRVLPHEKWTCLTNFRDNHIYFSTPIYIRKNFFEYYLSPDTILKFDIDDLFYYSSHKIMCRGHHFFVADYGMQVNIRNRYGIKNYAVEGKDFCFINGDNTDFRYENIEIHNSYHGVSLRKTKQGLKYISQIHIRGNYKIGYYSSAIEAAIAYNKAIDLLNKAGIKKNFTPNYLDNLSPSAYADIYSKLPISAKIMNYLRV